MNKKKSLIKLQSEAMAKGQKLLRMQEQMLRKGAASRKDSQKQREADHG